MVDFVLGSQVLLAAHGLAVVCVFLFLHRSTSFSSIHVPELGIRGEVLRRARILLDFFRDQPTFKLNRVTRLLLLALLENSSVVPDARV